METSTLSDSTLIGIAQLAVALVGFGGVVAVLGRRAKREWEPEETLQLPTMVELELQQKVGHIL